MGEYVKIIEIVWAENEEFAFKPGTIIDSKVLSIVVDDDNGLVGEYLMVVPEGTFWATYKINFNF